MRDYEPLPDNIFTPTENDIPISLSEEDVFVFLNSVKPEKSGGPDSLPNWVLLMHPLKKIKCLLVGNLLISAQYQNVNK